MSATLPLPLPLPRPKHRRDDSSFDQHAMRGTRCDSPQTNSVLQVVVMSCPASPSSRLLNMPAATDGRGDERANACRSGANMQTI